MNNSLPQQNNFFGANQNVIWLFLISTFLLVLQALRPEFWFVALFSLVPMCFAIQRLKSKWAWFWPFFVGFVFFSIVFYPLSTINTWWWTVSSGFFWDYRGLGFFLITSGLAFVCSLPTFGLTFYIYSKWFRDQPIWSTQTIIVLTIFWTLAEIFLVKLFFGLGWGIFGQALGENLFFARSVALWKINSIFILSFVAILFNFCFFFIIQNFLEKRIKQIYGPAIVILIVFGILILNNHSVSKKQNLTGLGDGKIDVAVINPNLKTADLAKPSGIEHIFDLILTALRSEADDKKINPDDQLPELVVLPENIFPTIIIDEQTKLPVNFDRNSSAKKYFEQLTAISKDHPTTSFVLGLHSQSRILTDIKTGPWDSVEKHNSAIVMENGLISSIYNKKELLPFTERSFSFLKSIHIEPLSAGNGEVTLKTRYGNFLPIICSELIVVKSLRRNNRELGVVSVPNEPEILASINLSNDNVFDSPRIARNNQIIARLQAIMSDQPIIRSAKGGFSGIFDASGQEIPHKTMANGEIILSNLNFF